METCTWRCACRGSTTIAASSRPGPTKNYTPAVLCPASWTSTQSGSGVSARMQVSERHCHQHQRLKVSQSHYIHNPHKNPSFSYTGKGVQLPTAVYWSSPWCPYTHRRRDGALYGPQAIRNTWERKTLQQVNNSYVKLYRQTSICYLPIRMLTKCKSMINWFSPFAF